ncbi:S8 family serine peptidase [Syntrophomonas wolfei]|uniref:Fervidolysin. Serine peptidase. MEROPS family S08A n=1 Tax=Syntrophomonas wolfei subsp. wolfei (strain DSM 2245B / Goettingen) TaxID=335541 RepID=Q0B0J0_SYNWW|nr:S8 family serine peptidase [Syntrophomonas wolfei]ABI67514.1 fervidolysin. Serine peptidase. MEROPS family S08A [Syntrophomonas wolfei subsp. wolfei str. Goettingen G311]
MGVLLITCQAGDILAANLSIDNKDGLIVQYRDNDAAADMLKTMDFQVYRKQNLAANVDLLKLIPGTNRQEMMARLKKTGRVKYVEENKRIRLHRAPNDPYYIQQWALPVIRAEAAWEVVGTTARPVVVAVVDSGIDDKHDDLINRIDSRGYNFVEDNQDIFDWEGHGTAVSSIIAAQTDNRLGIAGVNGQNPVKILPLKTIDIDGYGYISDIIKAIDYAIEAEVDVINLSMGSDRYSDIENEVIQKAINCGITVVASAGNEGDSRYDYPASYPGVISVGAIDRQGNPANFSNHNDQVDVVAPGVEIKACRPGNSYDCLNGTSFSAPMVTGTAAMLKSLDQSLQPDAICKIIQETSYDLGSPGRDNYYGYGVVDMGRAVLQVLPVRVKAIQLEPSQAQITMGETLQLKATFDPANSNNRNLAWSSDNEQIAVVNNQGMVRAVGVGQVSITAVSEDAGRAATCSITVVAPPPSREFITWKSREDVASNRCWHIRFSLPVNISSINLKTIYITDRQGNLLPVQYLISPEQDASVVTIAPVSNYTPGERFTLWIKNVVAGDGRILQHGIKMDFVITVPDT